jgi:hypothetical protein
MPFTLTPRIRTAARRYCGCRKDEDAESLQVYTRDDSCEISLEHVQQLSRALRRLPKAAQDDSEPVWVCRAPTVHHRPNWRGRGSGAAATAPPAGATPEHGPQVHELLQGAAPVLPAFGRTERAPHPSLAPRLEQLRSAAENREYAAMVGDVCCEESAGRDAAEMNTYRSQLAVGANLLVRAPQSSAAPTHTQAAAPQRP